MYYSETDIQLIPVNEGQTLVVLISLYTDDINSINDKDMTVLINAKTEQQASNFSIVKTTFIFKRLILNKLSQICIQSRVESLCVLCVCLQSVLNLLVYAKSYLDFHTLLHMDVEVENDKTETQKLKEKKKKLKETNQKQAISPRCFRGEARFGNQ
ncbi:unnamed protein product [Oppiella nova]|uniref:Uncharacterized protein n=1 Tax=Oppiella nova TaxID=334625 RepID=A0A7R9L9Z9_9ACAR|nr:unnamed protein product [Oppiella nova]CAG2161428.1 unnamed protein product [Oppiella nova]